MLKRDGPGGVEPLARPLSAPRFDRVYSLMTLPSRIQRPRTGFLKAIQRQWTEPHPARPAIEHVAQHPILRALGCDAQIEPAAIAIHPRLLRFFDFQRREPSDCTRHRNAPEPTILSTIIGRIAAKDGEREQRSSC